MSNKNPKTYEEQLEILKKRNLKILDENEPKRFYLWRIIMLL